MMLSTKETARTHRIVDGDTLADLAQRYFGSAADAQRLFDANRDVLSDPRLLPIGVELKIPANDSQLSRQTCQLLNQATQAQTLHDQGEAGVSGHLAVPGFKPFNFLPARWFAFWLVKQLFALNNITPASNLARNIIFINKINEHIEVSSVHDDNFAVVVGH